MEDLKDVIRQLIKEELDIVTSRGDAPNQVKISLQLNGEEISNDTIDVEFDGYDVNIEVI